MDPPYHKALFIFRRDLRLEDNTGLIYALQHAREVVPSFIFTPEQIVSNPYLGKHALQFLIESLEDLAEQLHTRKGKLALFFGKPEKVVATCIETLSLDAVVVNRDYTPYSIQRDRILETLCKKKKVAFHSFDDALLQPPEETLKRDGKPYTIFTPFYRNTSQIAVREPEKNPYHNYYRGPIRGTLPLTFYHDILPKRELRLAGGRKQGVLLLKRFAQGREGTSHLSAHLKFTTCSPREVYHTLVKHFGRSSETIRSLYWRDFFSTIAFFFPHVFQGAFRKTYDRVTWSNNKKAFTLWCAGKTGFPIVDAGMRELNETGFISNRLRMIVASFLVKDLHIDWRWGERYFAQQLSDYDPAVNNGNWQWVAGSGCDAQPYFRIFNPWTQAKRVDPEGVYIKKWVPELSALPVKTIHHWDRQQSPLSYLLPIVEHAAEAKKALEMMRRRG